MQFKKITVTKYVETYDVHHAKFRDHVLQKKVSNNCSDHFNQKLHRQEFTIKRYTNNVHVK